MKTYTKPIIKEKNVQPQTMIAGSNDGFGLTGNRMGDSETDFSNSRRGSWGNLWGNGEDEE